MEDPVVVILFVVFSVGCISICAHRVNTNIAQSRILTTRQPTQGIDPEAISAFPVVKYSDVKDIQIGKGILECAVCLTEFGDDDLVRLLPECDHVFHPLCIDQWLASHATCPICRTSLLQPPESETSAAAAPVVDTGLRNYVAVHIDDDDRHSTDNVISSDASKGEHQISIRRSPSTGDSAVHGCEGFDKHALKLPDGMKKQIQSRSDARLQDPNGDVLWDGEECSKMPYRDVHCHDDEMGQLGRFNRFPQSDWSSLPSTVEKK